MIVDDNAAFNDKIIQLEKKIATLEQNTYVDTITTENNFINETIER